MSSLMDTLMGFAGWMWGWPLVFILTLASIIYSFSLKFVQFTRFGFIMKNTLGKFFEKETKGEGTLTPVQAVSSALAGTLGTGNIAGVGVAIGLGGPGAVFWMWVVALLAAVVKYAEVVLGIFHREKDEEGVYRGGFMYMITNGLGEKWKPLAMIWSFLFFIQFFIGGAVQSNALADSLNLSFNTNNLVVGIITAILAGIVIIGGIKRIGKFAEKVVPLMAVLYFIGAVIIIILNLGASPGALSEIVSSAFSGSAQAGGFAGATFMMVIRHGFSRGVFSNEAGMGTSPIAHSTAITDHPSRQGIWGIFEVFIDTIVMCTMTAMVIMVTGTITSGEAGASLTALAFNQGLPGSGDLIVSLATVFFAFTTILLAEFYSETGLQYVFGSKVVKPFRYLFLIGLVLGAVGGLKQVWGLFDLFMALTVAINVIFVVAMRKDVIRLTEEFFGSDGKL
ncbi:MAG: alanine/glycine:cation symporter family protein [Halarsenatibacteraceae bacterium]